MCKPKEVVSCFTPWTVISALEVSQPWNENMFKKMFSWVREQQTWRSFASFIITANTFWGHKLLGISPLAPVKFMTWRPLQCPTTQPPPATIRVLVWLLAIGPTGMGYLFLSFTSSFPRDRTCVIYHIMNAEVYLDRPSLSFSWRISTNLFLFCLSPLPQQC